MILYEKWYDPIYYFTVFSYQTTIESFKKIFLSVISLFFLKKIITLVLKEVMFS